MKNVILKKGDIVMAKYGLGRYSITKDGRKGKVTAIRSSNLFDAIGIDGYETNDGLPFGDLDLDYFDIYKFCEN